MSKITFKCRHKRLHFLNFLKVPTSAQPGKGILLIRLGQNIAGPPHGPICPGGSNVRRLRITTGV